MCIEIYYFRSMEKIILASQSPRRKQLFELAEIPFEIKVVETDEHFPDDLSIEEIPIFIAKNKANAVLNLFPYRKIVAADTIVTIDHKIIGKPKNEEEAIQYLETLSGRTHQVITGVCILDGNNDYSFSEITEVEFDILTPNQIKHYVQSYRPFDKAGAYAIQEWIGITGIKKINGCYYNVMGLPMNQFLKYLNVLLK
ncbi:MAG: maf protein [Bacteroidetes bacterium OLB11]|nr:MAG: maf protein [Bacteroidetes bacterium OLB11]